ncbi:glycosyltransferase involved in cell wall biosynthesis [Mycobacterium sp. MAA66]|uniref:glycosyltransferase n=1 Tax=Mycobacterium sp. MAA66 TaxID=3156297 RepID=UPI003516D978
MRILQVVTLLTPDGAYGGPARVALNQAAALSDHSHDVTVAASCTGYAVPPTTIDGVRVQLFPNSTVIPRTGFAGTRARGMLPWLRTAISDFDVVHVHLARDFVTLPAARLALRNKPVVLQTHGMIDSSDRLLAKPLDALWTKPVLRQSSSIMYLTPREAVDLTEVAGPRIRLHPLPNGVPVQDYQPPADADTPEVLFLARLHPRKRPELFVEMAHQLLRSGTNARFALVGPDEGSGPAVRQLIAQGGFADRITLEPPIAPEHVARRMSSATIYVLPSVDEPFPMSVLEAMALGRPVVVSDTCGLAPMIRESGGGRVVNHSLAELAEAVGELLANPEAAIAVGSHGRAATLANYGMPEVAMQLEDIYTDAISTNRIGR